MNTFTSPVFWISLLVYVLSSFFIFLVPGFALLKKLRIQMESFGTMCLGFALGFVLWAGQGYIFGYIHVRVLTYAYVAICIVLFITLRRDILRLLHNFWQEIVRSDKFSLLLLVLGVVVSVLQTVGSGVTTNMGTAFYRVHIQDGVYHLSLIQSIVRSFPPMEPGVVGLAVHNYHYWSDLVFAEQSRIFHIAIPYLFFQFSPVLIAALTGVAVWALSKYWGGSSILSRAALFFLFFGADAGYAVAWAIHHVVSFQYPVIDNGATQFLNMPHAFAKLLFLAALLAVSVWVQKKEWRWGIVTVSLTTVLFGFKIYFALFMVLGLVCIGFYTVLRVVFSRQGKKDVEWRRYLVQQFLLGIIGGVLALGIYLPPNSGSGGLSYYPLEWPKLMLARDNIDWTSWREKYAVAQGARSQGKLLLYDVEAILVTIIAIHGVRAVGFLFTRKTVHVLGVPMIVFMVVPSLIFTWLGLYTLQVSGGFNVFNFFAVSLAVLALLTAFLAAEFWESRKLFLRVIVVVLVVVSLPRIVFETQKIIYSYKNNDDVHFVSLAEQEGLRFIDRHFPSECVVATTTENELDMKTPYVSYFSNRASYMSGESVLETHNQPTEGRYKEYRKVFDSKNGQAILEFLHQRNVCALYIQKDDAFLPVIAKAIPRIVFENGAAQVIDVR